MQAVMPATPLESGGEMFTRAKTRSVFLESWSRPVSMATDNDTEFEEESDMEFTNSPANSDFGEEQRFTEAEIFLVSIARDLGLASLLTSLAETWEEKESDNHLISR